MGTYSYGHQDISIFLREAQGEIDKLQIDLMPTHSTNFATLQLDTITYPKTRN